MSPYANSRWYARFVTVLAIVMSALACATVATTGYLLVNHRWSDAVGNASMLLLEVACAVSMVSDVRRARNDMRRETLRALGGE